MKILPRRNQRDLPFRRGERYQACYSNACLVSGDGDGYGRANTCPFHRHPADPHTGYHSDQVVVVCIVRCLGLDPAYYQGCILASFHLTPSSPSVGYNFASSESFVPACLPLVAYHAVFASCASRVCVSRGCEFRSCRREEIVSKQQTSLHA